MAYGTHYSFRFDSPNGTEFTIRLLQNGYEGPVLNRSLGQSPVLKRERNEHIFGTSLEIYAECLEDEEFAQLYTSDPYEWRVELEQADSIGGDIIWAGYVVPELYSEPDIAPPYDVQIIATDNLGELKYKAFTPDLIQGADTLMDVLNIMLGFTHQTGMGNGKALSQLTYQRSADALDFQRVPPLMIEWRGMSARYEDKTCYDVLQDILGMLNMHLMYNYRNWWLIREGDIEINAEGTSFRYFRNWQGSLISTLPDEIAHLGASSEWWPVGSLTSEVEPACNRVIVQETPIYAGGLVVDSDFITGEGWDKTPYVDQNGVSGIALGTLTTTYNFDRTLTTRTINVGVASMYSVPIYASASGKIRISVTCRPYIDNRLSYFEDMSTKGIELTVGVLKTYEGGATAYEQKVFSLPEGPYDLDNLQRPRRSRDKQQVYSTFEWEMDAWDGTIGVELFNNGGSRTSPTGFQCDGGCLFVDKCEISIPSNHQIHTVECVAHIDNGARMADSPILLPAMSGLNVDSGYRDDILTVPGGGDIYSWTSRTGTASRLLEFAAIDRVYEVALPRLRMRGTLNVPLAKMPPIVLYRRDVPYFLQTYSWKLYDDELEFEALSLPAVDTEVIDVQVYTKEE